MNILDRDREISGGSEWVWGLRGKGVRVMEYL